MCSSAICILCMLSFPCIVVLKFILLNNKKLGKQEFQVQA